MEPTPQMFHENMKAFDIRLCTFVTSNGDLYEYEHVSETSFTITKQGEETTTYNIDTEGDN